MTVGGSSVADSCTTRSPASVRMRCGRRGRRAARPAPGRSSGCRCRSSRPASRRRCTASSRGRRSPSARLGRPAARRHRCRGGGRTAGGRAPAGRRRRGWNTTRKSLPSPWCLVRRERGVMRVPRCSSTGQHLGHRIVFDVAPSVRGGRDGTIAPGGRRTGGCAATIVLDRLVERALALEVGDELLVAERLRAVRDSPPGAAEQPRHLVEQAGSHHLVHPRVDALRPAPVAATAGRSARTAIGGYGVEPGTERAERPAAAERNLERAHDAPRVGRLHPRRRHRVELGELARAAPRRPRASASASSSARTSGHSPGHVHRVGRAPRRYSPVPATSSGRRAAAGDVVERRASAAANSATVNSSPGSTRSRPWCGTAARSAAVGLAVPMSMPRYTCIASTATISTPGRAARRAPSRRRSCPTPSGPSDDERASGSPGERRGCATLVRRLGDELDEPAHQVVRRRRR